MKRVLLTVRRLISFFQLHEGDEHSCACVCGAVPVQAGLQEAFLKRCSQQTRISRGRQQLLRKGAPPAVQVSGERRQGNKYVTKVVGVEAFL